MTEENKNAYGANQNSEQGAASPQHASQANVGYTQPQPQMPAQATNAYNQQQAQAYQEQVYQAYAAQSAPQHVKTGASSKKSLGKTFGVSFAGAALGRCARSGGLRRISGRYGRPQGSGAPRWAPRPAQHDRVRHR